MLQFLKPKARQHVPVEHRANFAHLYADIAWFGVVAGSALAFASVYLARLGATPVQLGWMSAGPAVMNLLFSIPMGSWLESRPLGSSVVWTALIARLFYLLWALLPFFLLPQAQVWAILLLTLLMNIPTAGLNIGFNALFADVVPAEWRAHVAGARNALYAIVYVVTSLVCGWLLDSLPFPAGYQIVFGLGFLGGVMSTWHLNRIRTPQDQVAVVPAPHSRKRPRLRFDVVKGPFGRALAVLFAFHLTLFLAAPLFPIYFVDVLGLTDAQISLALAEFNAIVLVGSLFLSRFTARWGNQKTTAIGAGLVALFLFVASRTQNFGVFLAAHLLAGAGWALAGGAMVNYVLERVSERERAASLVWYNLAINGAMWLGALIGSWGGERLGVQPALLIYSGLRLLSALFIFFWG